MQREKQVPGSLRQYVDIFVLVQRPSACTTHSATPLFNKPSAATTRLSLCTEACSMHSQQNALISRQDYSTTHKNSNQIDTSRIARVVLCHILLYGQSTQHKPRRGMILTSKARSTLAPVNSSNTRRDKARDNYR